MSNTNHVALSPLSTKKEMKKAITGKIETALSDIRTALGEKKFHRRVRKAAKLLIQGIHSEDVIKKAKKKAAVSRAASIKKAAAPKTKKATKAKKVKAAALPEIFGQ